MYDVAVIGCGIAGAAAVFEAKRRGLSVLLLEQDFGLSNASFAAGAFLSPKFGPNSPYSDLINKAFNYSTEFYQKNFNSFFCKCGMVRLPRESGEIAKCDSYAEKSPFWQKRGHEYWCKKAGLISPEVIRKMAEVADEQITAKVSEFAQIDGVWNVEGKEARHLILSCGHKLLTDEPYLKIKPIFGQKLKARASSGFSYAIHRKCSISPIFEGVVQIGASHIPSWRYKEDEALFSEYKNALLNEAREILGGEIEVIEESRGFRSATADFFPYVGEVINAHETLLKMPYLKGGSFADKKRPLYHKNLYLHQGHGARGFVLAPFTAAHLIGRICGDKTETQTENQISLSRAFLRWCKKMKV